MSARNWSHLRQRPPAGRHRALPAITESPLSPELAASLPLPPRRPIAIATATEAEPEPDKIVECGFCRVSGLSSQIPEVAGMRRCWPDIGGCVQRDAVYRDSGHKPPPLLSVEELRAAVPAEALEPLAAAGPEPDSSTSLTSGNAEPGSHSRRSEGGPAEGVVEPADAAQHAATEALARWAPGETLADDEDAPVLSHQCLRGACEDCPDPVECACSHHEEDAARAADALAEHLGPDEQGFGQPAPVAAEPEPEDGGEGE